MGMQYKEVFRICAYAKFVLFLWCKLFRTETIVRVKEDIENWKENLISRMTDEEYDDLLMQLLEERKERKRKKEEDMEM